jgi:hypothetical protein
VLQLPFDGAQDGRKRQERWGDWPAGAALTRGRGGGGWRKGTTDMWARPVNEKRVGWEKMGQRR